MIISRNSRTYSYLVEKNGKYMWGGRSDAVHFETMAEAVSVGDMLLAGRFYIEDDREMSKPTKAELKKQNGGIMGK